MAAARTRKKINIVKYNTKGGKEYSPEIAKASFSLPAENSLIYETHVKASVLEATISGIGYLRGSMDAVAVTCDASYTAEQMLSLLSNIPPYYTDKIMLIVTNCSDSSKLPELKLPERDGEEKRGLIIYPVTESSLEQKHWDELTAKFVTQCGIPPEVRSEKRLLSVNEVTTNMMKTSDLARQYQAVRSWIEAKQDLKGTASPSWEEVRTNALNLLSTKVKSAPTVIAKLAELKQAHAELLFSAPRKKIHVGPTTAQDNITKAMSFLTPYSRNAEAKVTAEMDAVVECLLQTGKKPKPPAKTAGGTVATRSMFGEGVGMIPAAPNILPRSYTKTMGSDYSI